jgi:hypothetical protein
MKYTVEEIANSVGLDPNDILNVYCYGSRVYGTDDEYSDDDFVVVHKGFSIKNSYNDEKAFNQNAITSKDGQIQVVRYSRSGFQSAIDKYEIGAMECLFLPEDKVIQEDDKVKFSIRNFDKPSVDYEIKQMVKKVITKASNSWFLGNRDVENERFEKAEKAYFHTIRILMFGLQIKNNKKIVDFTEANYIWEQMLALEEPLTYKKVKTDFLPLRDELMEELRK